MSSLLIGASSVNHRQPSAYRIGWICALDRELTASRAMLTNTHGPLREQAPNDNNIYVLGDIGGHNIVIACLPDGNYGNISAATVATNMMRTFRNIEFGLMVGIGGGMPSDQVDIRLGDVAVSRPSHTDGGVIQYDMGKVLPGNVFERRAVLNKPPKILLAAISDLKSRHDISEPKLFAHMAEALQTYPRMEPDYAFPGRDNDQLFDAECEHMAGYVTCELCGPPREKQRLRRADDRPAIHYGLIGSGNKVIASADERERLLRSAPNMICVEMEAAGLMDDFPCLLIRGISDYADAYKRDHWQKYAALAAAAYAKELLEIIPPSGQHSWVCPCVEQSWDVIPHASSLLLEDSPNRATEDLTTLNPSDESIHAAGQLDGAMHPSERQSGQGPTEMKAADRERLEKMLLSNLQTSHFPEAEDLVPDRHHGTCEWIHQKQEYQNWNNGYSSPVLFLLGGTGRGKSVIAKYLQQGAFHSNKAQPRALTLCFFCRESAMGNQAKAIIKSFLYELMTEERHLFRQVIPRYEALIAHGRELPLQTLWNMLREASRSRRDGTIFVIDGLDECEAESQALFLGLLQDEFAAYDVSGPSKDVRFFITSRPTSHVAGYAARFPSIEIEPNDVADDISQLLSYRIERMVYSSSLPPDILQQIKAHIEKNSDGLFIWVQRVLERVDRPSVLVSRDTVGEFLSAALPTLQQLYIQALAQIPPESRLAALRILGILAYGAQPLLKDEFSYLFMTWPENCQSHADLVSHIPTNAIQLAKSICGSLISVTDDAIRLYHATTRETLLDASLMDEETAGYLNHGFVNSLLAKRCLEYLLLDDFSHPTKVNFASSDQYPLLQYAGKCLIMHLNYCSLPLDEDLTRLLRKFLDCKNPNYQSWSQKWGYIDRLLASAARFHERSQASMNAQIVHELAAAGVETILFHSILGPRLTIYQAMREASSADSRLEITNSSDRHLAGLSTQLSTALVFQNKLAPEAMSEDYRILDMGPDVDVQDGLGNTALIVALLHDKQGLARVFVLLGSDPTVRNRNGQSAYHVAAKRGLVQFLRDMQTLSQDRSAPDSARLSILTAINTNDKEGMTPLHLAAQAGEWEAVDHLIKVGAVVDNLNAGFTALQLAAARGHLLVVQRLLDAGAEIDVSTSVRAAPLNLACLYNHVDVANLLLDSGAAVDYRTGQGQSPLHSACSLGNLRLAERLAMEGLSGFEFDRNDTTPAHLAAYRGHLDVVSWLFADLSLEVLKDFLNTPSSNGWTCMMWAARGGHLQVVQLLVNLGAVLDAVDPSGRDCLHVAALSGQAELTEWLLGLGLQPLYCDGNGASPLHNAAISGSLETMKALVSAGADVHVGNNDMQTALHEASSRGHLDIVNYLLSCGVDVNAQTVHGGTSLQYAAQYGHLEVCQALSAAGASLSARDTTGFNALALASYESQAQVMRWLIEQGASVDFFQEVGMTPLQLAAQWGHEEIVHLLIGLAQRPEDLDGTVSETHRTALHLAVQHHFPKSASLLVAAGANPHLRDYFGRTALDWAYLHPPSFEAMGHWTKGYVPTAPHIVNREVRASVRRIAAALIKDESDDIHHSFWRLGNLLLHLRDDENANISFEMLITRDGDGGVKDLGLLCDRCGWVSNKGAPAPKNISRAGIYLCRVCAECGFCEPCMELYNDQDANFKGCQGHELVREPRDSWYNLPDGVVNEAGQTATDWLKDLLKRYTAEEVSRGRMSGVAQWHSRESRFSPAPSAGKWLHLAAGQGQGSSPSPAGGNKAEQDVD